MIRQLIELYVGGQKLDLIDNGGIYLNYRQKETRNPTVVKNMFSKTLNIPGTDINNRIFNNIWNLTRVQTTDIVPYFNQSKRVDFQLYLDGELIEQGYCKMDSIERNGPEITYNLSLYGGLGDFFYNLSYDASNGTKKTLASLDFGQDLSFIINKDTVKDEWDALSAGTYNPITFAPCYNGIPSIIDAEKTLINTSGYTGMTRCNTGEGWYEMPGFYGSTDFEEYKTIDRYALAEGAELDEWQTRDLRSYMQRCVLHIPALFDAISNPDNNGGYEIVLDPDFFNSGNSYYQNAYITLPLITELDANKEDITSAITATNEGSAGDSTSVTNIGLSMEQGWNKYSVSVNLMAYTNETNEPYLYTSQRINSAHGSIMGGFAMQLIGIDVNGAEVTGSNIVWMTTRGQFDPTGDDYAKYENVQYGNLARLKNTDTVDYSFGDFMNTDINLYMWSETGLTLNLETNVALSGFKIRIVPGCYVTRRSVNISPSHIGKVWSATTATDLTTNCYTLGFNVYLVSTTGTKKSEKSSYSNVEVSQASLLNTEYTPADYLLSYCKLFNLYFDKDVYGKKVTIYCQKNFYDRSVDLQDDVHNALEIQPLSFSHKWYSFNYAEGQGELIGAYKSKYGTDYGQQRVNTGFEFDAETEELLKNNIFKNAVDYLPSNKYFVQVKDENGVDLPNFLLDNVTYHLYNDDGDPNDISVGISRKGSYSSINPKSTETIQYDSFNKVQFNDEREPTDGANVLLFFNGMKTVPVNYWITDDLAYMFQLNDKATWLWTANEYDSNGSHIAIKTNTLPQFSRYIMDDDYIYASWDFGRVRELYIPEISYIDGNATIYERYWRAYINDLYDVDTRIVTAYIKFDERPTKESLKHFYYFENCYWVIDEIIDYNPTSYELTKVKFVKVNDKNNYLNNNIVPPSPTPIPSVSITSTSPIAYDATQIGWYVHKSDFVDAITVTLSGNGTSQVRNITGLTGQVGVQSNFTIPANTGASITYTLVVSLPEYPGYTDSTTVQQQAAPVPDTISITSTSPIPATATSIAYTVTGTKPLRVELYPDHIINTHASGTSLGSFTIPANTAATAEYYSLVAWLLDDPSVSAATSITQDGVGVYVTGISLSSTWATDVPATGGTATYQNCTNVVTAHYSDGTSADITSSADFSLSTSLNVPSTTSTTRDSVGVISVIASYYDGPNPFTSTVVVTAYQQAYVPPTPTETWYAESNISTYGIYGNGLYGGDMVCGFEVLPFETEPHTEAVPFTIDELWLGPSPTPPTNSAIIASNSRTSQSIRCEYSTSNNAWIGTGQIDIAQGDTVLFELIQTRGTVQEEPEPDEEEPEETTEIE